MDNRQVLELVNAEIKRQQRSALRTYITFAVLGLLSSSAVVFAVVQLTDYKTGDVLTAKGLNDKFNAILSNIAQIESGVGSVTTPTQEIAGAVSIDPNTALVIGFNTAFDTELQVGDALSIMGEVHSIASIEGPGNLTLDADHTVGASIVLAYTDGNLLTIKTSAGKNNLVVDKSGNLIANGFVTRRIARATGLGPNVGQINALVPGRTLSMNKMLAETTLRIAYSESFGVNNVRGGCRWEILIDGNTCPSGALVYDISTNINIFRSASVFGYCKVPAAGSHTITIHSGPVPGSVEGQCYTGWSASRWTLEAEEVW